LPPGAQSVSAVHEDLQAAEALSHLYGAHACVVGVQLPAAEHVAARDNVTASAHFA
jgi:hypothetical protein